MSPRERSPEELAEDMAELRADMTRELGGVRDQVARLADRLDAAPFVRKDVHDVQVAGITKELGNLDAKIGGTHTLVMWTLGILLSSIVGAIIVLVISVGRGG